MLFLQLILLGISGLDPATLFQGTPASFQCLLVQATIDIEDKEPKANDPGDDENAGFTMFLKLW